MATAPKTPFWKKKRNSPEDPEEFRLTLVEHLEELRARLMRSLAILVVGWVAGWFIEPIVFGHLNGMITKTLAPVLARIHVESKFVFESAPDAFMLKFKMAMIIGFILTFPFLILQLWGFIEPALKPNERKPFRIAAPFSILLFATGATFCWFIIPNTIAWFATYLEEFPGTSLFQNVPELMFFTMKLLLAFGIAFQLPLIVYALNALGLLETETLMKNWRKATFVVFAVAMIVTPSNDFFTMLSMAIPVSILFLITIVVVKFASRKRAKQALLDEDE
jgi:sec-independent protein translocase protein TatC